MVYKDLFDISLGHYKIKDIDSPGKTMDKIEEVRDSSKKWSITAEPEEGDVAMMITRTSGRPEHVGLYIGNNEILHSLTRENGQSEIHNIKLINKLFKRIEFYKYDF